MTNQLELAPNHLVDNTDVGLDDANDLGRYVFVHIVRHGDTGETVTDERDGYIDALQEALGVDAGEDKAAFVQGFGALGGGADADGREGMADGCEEGRLLRQGTTIRNHAEGVHLQAIVVVEAQGFVLDDARVKLESRSLQTLAGARVAAVEDGHIVLLGHRIDGGEEREEVLLGINVFLTVGGEKNVATFLQTKASVNVAGLNLCEVVMQDFRHRGASHISALLGKASVSQITTRMFRIRHVHITDDIHDAAVGLLRQTLVLAAVTGLHVEDGDVEPLRANDREAGVGIAQHKDSIRLNLHHQLIRLGDDISHRLAQVAAHGFHIHVRVSELQILEEHPVEVVVVILPSMRQEAVEVFPTLVNYCGQTNNLRPRSYYDKKLQLPVISERFSRSRLGKGQTSLSFSLAALSILELCHIRCYLFLGF